MALLSLIAIIVGIYFFRKKLNPKNKTTNALIVFGVVILGVVVYLPYSSITPSSNNTNTVKQAPIQEKPKISDTARDEVVAYFKSGKEPKVKDTVWTKDDVFKVGMINDKTDRSGYADYVCTVLYDFGFKGHKYGCRLWI